MKIFFPLILIASVVFLQFCTAGKQMQKQPLISYQNNVHPLIINHCSPCHISPTGKQATLNNYAAAKESIDNIISRIQKNPGEKGFMPFKHPKLADSTVSVFVQWKNNGLAE